jgi:hypothetical protein
MVPWARLVLPVLLMFGSIFALRAVTRWVFPLFVVVALTLLALNAGAVVAGVRTALGA